MKGGIAMIKRFYMKMSLLMSLFLILQLGAPSMNALAADTSTMLPPSNLSVQILTPDDAKLMWSSVYGATGYNVYGIIDGQLILLGSTKTTYYTVNDLPEGSYRYVVSTLNGTDESGPCAPVSVDIVYPTMAAPATLTYSMQNGNDAVLNWGASQYAESYNVYEVKPDGQTTLVTSATGLTYKLVNMPVGTYKYVVSSVNSKYGESSPSTAVQFEVIYPAMLAPSTFTSTMSNVNDVNLRWSAVTYATGYKIYQVIGAEKVLKDTVTGTSVSYTRLLEGDYVYEIHSYSDRFGESTDSKQVSIAVATVTMVAPSSFTYKIQNANDIVLTWGAVTNATSYKLYQIIDGQKVLKSTATGTTITYTNMPAGNYNYEIHSYSDRFGESTDSKQVSIAVATATMVAPGNFTYKIQNGNDIVLTWGAVTNATGYKLYQIIDGQKALKSTVTGTTVTYTNMPAGNYNYEVNSYSDRFGESAEGSQITFTLDPVTMVPPSNLTANIQNVNDIVLTWETAPNANNYKVYQITDGGKVLKSTVTGTTVSYTKMPANDYSYEVHAVSTRFGESLEGSQVSVSVGSLEIAPPSNLSYTIKNGNDIVLTWGPLVDANSYKVYQVTNGQKVLKSTVSGTAVTYVNLPAGDYAYEVHSYSTRFGQSQESSAIAITVVRPVMAPPTNFVQKIQSATKFTLSWDAALYASSYKVYQIVNGQKILKNTSTSTSAVFLNMFPGEYTFEVHAYSSRFGESVDGTMLTMTLNGQTMQEPINPSFSITSGNNITLKWTAVPYANSYKIYQIIDGQKVLKSTITGTGVVYSNMPEGDYQFVLHSYSTLLGESPDGVELTFSLTFPTMQAPASFVLKVQNGNDVVLTWATVPYASTYKVYELIDGQEVLKTTVTTLSVLLSNVESGNHIYVVHSVSSRFGESQEGAQVSATLQDVTMSPPTNLTYSISNGNDITLRWNASAYANNYKIYQVVGGEKVLKSTVTGTAFSNIKMPAGNYSYEVYSYSTRFGESSQASTVDFGLVWPGVQAPILKGDIFNANNITLSWPAVTWANEYRIYEVKGNERQLLYKGNIISYKLYNLTEDTHYYEVTAYNTRFGESAPSNRLVENIVYPIMQSPVANLKVLSATSVKISWDFVVYANGYNIYEIIDGQPVLLVKNLNNLSYTLSDLSYVDHEYIVTSFSNSFGESEPSNKVIAKLIVDTEPPVTTANAPNSWTNQNPIAVTLSATDNETGVAGTYYAINDGVFIVGTSVMIEDEGVTKLSFYSVDKVGNIEKPKTIYVKIDKTAPAVTMDLQEEYKLGTMLPISFLASDAMSGIADTKMTVYVPNDATGQVVHNGTDFLLDKPGVYQVTVTATDAAGLTTTIQKQFVVFITASIEVTPKVIKGNNGVFTVRAYLPNRTQGFDLNTATLNGVKALTSNNGYYNQAKLGQFKFERSQFNWTPSEMTVTLRCYVDGNLVIGQTTVQVQK